jgi:hypothetical protein
MRRALFECYEFIHVFTVETPLMSLINLDRNIGLLFREMGSGASWIPQSLRKTSKWFIHVLI